MIPVMNRSNAFRRLLLLAMLLSAAACQPQPKPDGMAVLQQQLAAEAEALRNIEHTPPIIAVWDNGNLLTNTPPMALFAIWADGRIVRRLEGRLYAGKVTDQQARQLLERLVVTRVTQPPVWNDVIRPMGGSWLLWVSYGGQQYFLVHDISATWDDFEGITDETQRQQVYQFNDIWSQALAALNEIWPQRLTQVLFMPGLEYPQLITEQQPQQLQLPGMPQQ